MNQWITNRLEVWLPRRIIPLMRPSYKEDQELDYVMTNKFNPSRKPNKKGEYFVGNLVSVKIDKVQEDIDREDDHDEEEEE